MTPREIGYNRGSSYHNHNQHDLNSTEISSRFKIEKILGKGAFATVYKASRRQIWRNHDGDIDYRCENRNPNTLYRDVNRNNHDLKNNKNSCNRRDLKENYAVCLKVVNLSKVTKRRRQRKEIEAGKLEAVGKGGDYERDAIRKDMKHAELLMLSEYDTEELFFPSRVQLKKRMDVKQQQSDNLGVGDDNDECAATRKMINREISVHLNISRQKHPNIASMVESFHYNVLGDCGSKDLVVVMVMEYCQFGDLQHYLKRKRDERQAELAINVDNEGIYDQGCKMIPTLLDEREIQYAMRHILRGLAFLHSRGIVHRDIKAGNILLSISSSSKYYRHDGHDENSFNLFDCCLKIGDFGLAVQMSEDDDWDEAQHTICGTPFCLAPEVALSTPDPRKEGGGIENEIVTKGKPIHDIRGHGQPADLWSVGCLFYVMLVGGYPFSRNVAHRHLMNQNIVPNECKFPDKVMKMKQTIQRVVDGDWSVPDNISLSATAYELLSRLLSVDPKMRGFARGLLSTHPFFDETKGDRKVVHTASTTARNSSGKIGQHECEIEQQPLHRTICPTKEVHEVDESSVGCISPLHTLIEKSIGNNILKSKLNHQESLDPSREVSSHRFHASIPPFIRPLEDINQLPKMKYKWELKKNDSLNLLFTVFILPERQGLVFQCEKTCGRGVWMHITDDGENIYLGRLRRSPRRVSFIENMTRENLLLFEAFSRHPKKLERGHDKSVWTIGNHEHQSMCTFDKIGNTMYSTPSTHSVSSLAHSSLHQTKYKKLSCLLQKKNRTFLSLYKKLAKFLRVLKNNSTKLHLDIHERENNKSNDIQAGKLLCTVTLVDYTKGIISVKFTDGLTVTYDRSTGFAEVSGVKLEKMHKVGSIMVHLQSNDLKLKYREDGDATGDTFIKSHYSYLQFARSAIKKCIEIKQDIESKDDREQCRLSNRRMIVVNGKSFRSWVEVTSCCAGGYNKDEDDQTVMVESMIKRNVIDDNYETSLSLLG